MDEKRKRLENTLDFYNEKMTKKAVGRLFQEYIEEGEENYFFPPDRDDENNSENSHNSRVSQNTSRGRRAGSERKYDTKAQAQYDNSYEGYNGDNQPYDNYNEEYYYDEEGYEDNYENGYEEDYDDIDSYDDEYEEYMQDNPEVDYNKNYSYDTVKLYSPRRKRTPKNRGSKKENAGKSKKKTVENKKAASAKAKSKKQRDAYEEQYYEDNGSFSFLTLVLGFFTVAFLVAIIVLCFKLSAANTEIKHLNNRLNSIDGENLTGVSATKALEEKKKAEEENNAEATSAGVVSGNNGASVNSNNSVNASSNTASSTNNSTAQEQTTVSSDENSTNKKTDNNVNQSTNNSADTENNSEDTSSQGNSSIPKTYTVEKGDNAWKISKKIYGTGDYYLKILEANKLDENGALVVGQEIVIPEV